jgi:tetratricopeptide (TPR) repeat protein
MFATAAVVGLLASPVLADKKLDEALAKAQDQILKGRPEEAIKNFQKAAAQAPGSEPQVMLGNLQAQLGNWDDAAAAFSKARDLAATEPPAVKANALAAVAAHSLAVGSAKDAMASAQAAVAAQPTAEALAALARAQVRSNEAAEGLKTADKAIAANGHSALAHEAKGAAYVGLGMATEAAASYRKAIELDPKLTRARAFLAVNLASSGKAAEAVAEAKKATELDAKSGEAFAALGAAILAENPKNWSEAIAQAQQGAFLNPKSPVVQHIVGKIFEANANFDQSASAYKKALESDPGFSPARLALVNAKVLQGDKGVLADLQQLAKEMPNNGEVQFLLGRTLMRAQDFTNALPVLEKAAQLSPGLADALALYATAAFYNGKNDLAVAAYKKALDLKPDNVQWRTDYGLFLSRNGDNEAAITELKKVVATPGYKDAAGWANLGYAYRNSKPPKVEESIVAYKKALELDPKEEQAALGLGWAYMTSQKYEDSIAAYNKAAQIEPKLAGDAYNGIAWSHFFKKDMAQAKAFAAKAKEAGRPNSSLVEQIANYEKAMAAGPNTAASEDAMKRAREAQAQAQALNAINEGLRNKSAGVRMRAARDLAASGSPDTVSTLTWLLVNDKDWGVKQAACVLLGNAGAAAKPAAQYVRQFTAPCSESIVQSREEMEESLLCEDTRKTCTAALAKIPK